jgi:hypothetical protein
LYATWFQNSLRKPRIPGISDAVEESHDLEEPSKAFRRIHPCKAVLQVHRVPQSKHCILEQ